MARIGDIAKKIAPLNIELMKLAQARLDNLTKPQGSLGRMEELAKNIVGISGIEKPVLKDKVIFTFAADHGVADEGVSAFPKEVTAQMVLNFLNGGAGINVLARHAGARIVVADLGVAAELAPHKALIQKKVGFGTKSILQGAAMTRKDAERSIEAGIEIFEDEYKRGIDIIGTGDMGIANTTPSSAITAVFTGRDVIDITGRGTGIDAGGLEKKVQVIKRAIKVNNPDKRDAIDVLSKVGGFEIGGLAGVILAAASYRVPVMLDGFISGAAALIAFHIEPKVRDYMIASHSSVEKGHKIILEHMGLKPVLDLNLRLGEGTGAAIGISIADASCKILNEMATFSGALVSEKISK